MLAQQKRMKKTPLHKKIQKKMPLDWRKIRDNDCVYLGTNGLIQFYALQKALLPPVNNLPSTSVEHGPPKASRDRAGPPHPRTTPQENIFLEGEEGELKRQTKPVQILLKTKWTTEWCLDDETSKITLTIWIHESENFLPIKGLKKLKNKYDWARGQFLQQTLYV